MLPMNSEKLTDLTMWWPSPEALNDLTITDIDNGWQLSAPDDTELASWLNYWDQDEEHQEFFNVEFVSALLSHLERIETHGKNEDLPLGVQCDREQAQENLDRSESQHQSGGNSLPAQAP